MTPTPRRNQDADRGKLDERWRELLSAATDHLSSYQPRFDFSVRWVDTFDDIFEPLGESEGVETLLRNAFDRGRVLLQAEGGAGKTSVLWRLVLLTREAGVGVPVRVDLRDWNHAVSQEWEAAPAPLSRLETLFRNLATPSVTIEELNRDASDQRVLLLVDGLNEIPSYIATSMLRLLDVFARRNPTSGVVVTDRLTRRQLDSEVWALATLDRIAGDAGLRGNAFFRDLLGESESERPTAAAVEKAFLSTHASLGDGEIMLAGRAAYEAYAVSRSRTFDLSQFRELATEPVTERLIASGLIADSPLSSFTHHLHQDFLAAEYVGDHEDQWTAWTFDTLTLDGASFDALALLLELVPPGRGDRLLTRIYDWNLYAAGYVLAAADVGASPNVSSDMRNVLIAMFGARRWDLLKSTVQQSEDALRAIGTDFALQVLAIESMEALTQQVATIEFHKPEFRIWQRTFVDGDQPAASTDLLRYLEGEDSVLGWTAANVLRSKELSRSVNNQLHAMYEGADAVVRWRIVHVLGSAPSASNEKFLLGALTDEDQWVRFGAIRSVVEIAALNEGLRRSVFEDLSTRTEILADDARVADHLARAVVLRDPPQDWADAAGILIERLWIAAPTQGEQDRWRRVALEMRKPAQSSAVASIRRP